MNSEKAKDIFGMPSNSSQRNGQNVTARVGVGMSVGAIPKQRSSAMQKRLERKQASRSLAGENAQNSDSEFTFELEPKPKSTCIALSQTKKYRNDLPQTQSLMINQTPDMLDKSWSVLYIGYKNKL